MHFEQPDISLDGLTLRLLPKRCYTIGKGIASTFGGLYTLTASLITNLDIGMFWGFRNIISVSGVVIWL